MTLLVRFARCCVLMTNERYKIVFLFTGQGLQYPNMTRDLYDSVFVYRTILDNCLIAASLLCKLDFYELLFPNKTPEKSAEHMQTITLSPVIQFITQYALAKLLIYLGIKPDYLLGHSIGEYVSAAISGLLSFEDALGLVYYRGQLMETLPEGAMLAVPLEQNALQPYLNDQLSIAALHFDSCIVSGSVSEIQQLETKLKENLVLSIRLPVKRAGHSKIMSRLEKQLKSKLETLHFAQCQLPIISSLTGDAISSETASTSTYWLKQMSNTVNFKGAVSSILNLPRLLFIELGAGNALSSMLAELKHPDLQTLTMIKTQYDDSISERAWFYAQLSKADMLAYLQTTLRYTHLLEKNYLISLPNRRVPLVQSAYTNSFKTISAKMGGYECMPNIELSESSIPTVLNLCFSSVGLLFAFIPSAYIFLKIMECLNVSSKLILLLSIRPETSYINPLIHDNQSYPEYQVYFVHSNQLFAIPEPL